MAAGGTGTARFNLDEEVDVRDYMNEGGKLFFTGQYAGRQWAEGYEVRNYGFPEPPEGGEWCSGAKPEFDKDDPSLADGCIAHNNDFLQYYLGAYVYVQGGQSTDPVSHALYDMAGSGPLDGLGWKFDTTGAGNQANSATFPVTSTILDPARFPTFASSRSIGSWLRPGAAPFDPFTGAKYAAAGADDASYKRLHQTVDLTGKTAGELTFKASYDLEGDYDYMFVEAVELGAGDVPDDDTWTTLPDVNGHTSDDTGLSCPSAGAGSNWQDDHPFLDHYQTPWRAVRTATRPARRRVERGDRLVRRLGRLEDRPVGLRRQEDRAVHHGRHRSRHHRARRLDRRREGHDRRRHAQRDVVRGRARRVDGRAAARGHGEPRERLAVDRPLLHGGRRGGHRRLGLHRLRVRGRQRGGTARAHEAGHGAPGRDGHAPATPPGGNPPPGTGRRSTPRRGSPRSASSAWTASGA